MTESLSLSHFGRYQTLSVLGHGGCGIVYKAWDPEIQRLVAIKTPLTNVVAPGEIDQFAARFRLEARAAGKLDHPNIVSIYDYGEEHGTPYFVMEYLQGETLQQRISREKILPIESALPLFLQICSAIQYAHVNKMIHRDLKPSNIMLLETGSVKVVDFGIVKSLAAELTHMGGVLGTPHYMSPESLRGAASDHRADIFSLGVMLYEVLAGAKPFDGENVASLSFNMVHRSPVPPERLNSAINPALSSVILKALAKEPTQRYQSCQALANDLKCTANLPTSAMIDAEVTRLELARQVEPVEVLYRPVIDIDCETTTLLPNAEHPSTEISASLLMQSREAEMSDAPTASLGLPLHNNFRPELAVPETDREREHTGPTAPPLQCDLSARCDGAVVTHSGSRHASGLYRRLRRLVSGIRIEKINNPSLIAFCRRPIFILSLITTLSLPPVATLAFHVTRNHHRAGIALMRGTATPQRTKFVSASPKSRPAIGEPLIVKSPSHQCGSKTPYTHRSQRSKRAVLQILLTDKSGRPLANAQVMLLTLAGRLASNLHVSDDAGTAVFKLLPGRYTVQARLTNNGPLLSNPVRIFPSRLTKMRLQLQRPVIARSTRQTQAAPVATSSLAGHIEVAGLGIGVANVPVQILRSDGKVLESFRTDEHGSFRAKGLTADTYGIAISPIFPLRAKRVQCPPVEPGRTSVCTLLLDPPVFRFPVTQRHHFSRFSGFLTVTEKVIILTETQVGSPGHVVGYCEPLKSLTIRRWRSFGIEIQAGDGRTFHVSLYAGKNGPGVARDEVDLLMKLSLNFKREVESLLNQSRITMPRAGVLLSLANGREP